MAAGITFYIIVIGMCAIEVCSTQTTQTTGSDLPRAPVNLRCECRDFVNINCSWEMDNVGDANASVFLQIQEPDSNTWLDVSCRHKNPSSKDKYQYCFFNPFDFRYTNPENNYRVYTHNDFATITTESIRFHKSSQAVPYPPDDITLKSYSSSSMTTTWCGPKTWPPSQFSVLVFKVEYKAAKDKEWIVKGTENLDYKTGCKTINITELEAYTLYCTRISTRKSNALRSVPFSEPSEPVCGHTLEDTPGPPFDVKFDILPSTNEDKETRSARITWMPVPEDRRNGIILGYRIVLYGTHAKDHTNVTRLEYNVTGDVTNLTVQGLDNYMTYTISVQAFNSAGMSWEKATPEYPIVALVERTDVSPAPPACLSLATIVIGGVLIGGVFLILISILLALGCYCYFVRRRKQNKSAASEPCKQYLPLKV